MPLGSLIHLISTISLLIGVLLSVNAGRTLARRRHDLELARRYGRELPGLGIVVYIHMFLAFLFNLSALTLSQLVSGGVKLLVAVATGGFINFIASILLTILLIGGSYVYFSRRYRGVDKPLTREGRLALRGVELGKRGLEGVKRRLRREP